MFTSRSERQLFSDKHACGENIGPGTYDAGARPSRIDFRKGDAYYQLPTYIDEAVRSTLDVPPVGVYNVDREPSYARAPKAVPFNGREGRFRENDVGCAPSPVEYFGGPAKPRVLEKMEQEARRKAFVEAQRVPALDRPGGAYEEPAESIPGGKHQKRLRPADAPSWANPEHFETPGPVDYPVYKRQLPDAPPVIPAVGGSSLTSYTHRSPWAVYKERGLLTPLPKQTLGPASYKTEPRTPPRAKRSSGVFLSTAQRFDYQKPKNPLATELFGRYDVQAGHTIAHKHAKARARRNLRSSEQEKYGLSSALYEQMYPNIYRANAAQANNICREELQDQVPTYLTECQKEQINTPAPGAYDLSEKGKRGAPSAPVRPPPVPATYKYQRQAPSIPQPYIDLLVVSASPKYKKQSIEPFKLYTERPPIAVPQKNQPAVGYYDVEPQKPLDYPGPSLSTKGNAAFASRSERGIYENIKNIEREIVRQEQNRRRYLEDQLEQRYMGGAESVVNFTAARFGGYKPQVAFGAAERKHENIVDTPGPGQYDVEGQSLAKEIKLYQTDRPFENAEKLPAVLKEDIGPGARNALRILAERKAMASLIGPQSYQIKSQSVTKRSFNSLAEENQLH